ncbi:hypothetical protein [Wenzhouxiangella limi]|uniref:Rax2-like C-terminal domain-containing protein n=1 Tax=Wenzhouxiangella limi TaxID=2707351 RepID=A0A845V217_9GAMM|nr:hypothetical protein [Wenzhouxiangella limi]NDY96300.1 hypothetical protein [Wenzhouxiangella limi]
MNKIIHSAISLAIFILMAPIDLAHSTKASGEPAGLLATQARALEGASWTRFGGSLTGCDGPVDALTAGDDGMLYLSGTFRNCGGVEVPGLASYDPKTDRFRTIGTPQSVVNGRINALTFHQGALHVAGIFDDVGDLPASNIARWTGDHWEVLGDGNLNGVNGPVNALETDGDALYVGGQFTEAGGQPANGIAKYSASAWRPIGQAGDNGVTHPISASVNVIKATPEGLYVAGQFEKAGQLITNNIALWDGTDWQSLPGQGGVGVDGVVNALVVKGTSIYVGGGFSAAGGSPASNIAEWTSAGWSPLQGTSANGTSRSVFSLEFYNQKLFVGGRFNTVGDITANYVASWDGNDWASVVVDGQNGLSGGTESFAESGSVRALFHTNDRLYLAGNFTVAGEKRAFFLTSWDDNEWQAIASESQQGLGSFGLVDLRSIERQTTGIFAGGLFAYAGGQITNGIGFWDGTFWQPLGRASENGIDGSVETILANGDNIYVGGRFSSAGSIPASNIALWDGGRWNALGPVSANGLDGDVFAMAIYNSELYVGGRFSLAGDVDASGIARWDGARWEPVGPTGENGVDGAVFALDIYQGDLYVGGSFSRAGDITANNLARWNGTDWKSVGDGQENGVSELSSTFSSPAVTAFAHSPDGLIVGGRFEKAGSVAARNIASWDGQQWKPLGGGVDGPDFVPFGPQQGVLSLASKGDFIFAGGNLDQAGDQAINNVALWNGFEWVPLATESEDGVRMASGAASNVSALSVTPDGVWIGGSFDLAGGKASEGIAHFTHNLTPAEPLTIQALQTTLLVDQATELKLTGISGENPIALEVSEGEQHCSLQNLTLTAQSEGRCIVTARETDADGNVIATASAVFRIVTEPGVNLVVDIDVQQTDARVSCQSLTVEVFVTNQGPVDAPQVRATTSLIQGLLDETQWSCEINNTPCQPPTGTGVVDTVFPIPIGSTALIKLTGCAQPDAAFAEVSAAASPTDDTPLLFADEAQVVRYLPVNNDGLFRSRFQ